MNTFEENIEEYSRINTQIRELEKTKLELRSKIMIDVKLKDVNQYETDTLILKFTINKRKNLDKFALEEYLNTQNKELADFESETEYEMLRISQKNELEVE